MKIHDFETFFDMTNFNAMQGKLFMAKHCEVRGEWHWRQLVCSCSSGTGVL